jgi:hypothetical protein
MKSLLAFILHGYCPHYAAYKYVAKWREAADFAPFVPVRRVM